MIENIVIFLLVALAYYLGKLSNRGTIRQAYKQGQVDAMTGFTRYELTENEDRTKEWTEIEEKEE